jgi:curved DNA-binding protein CbpA
MADPHKTAEASFKDYYLILQVHPEADFAMIDAAYWHLARRYNQSALANRAARAQLDELNEAYAVLGSATRREAYDRRRNEVLGLGALPLPPPPPPERTPLAVMQRQRRVAELHSGVATGGSQRPRRGWLRLPALFRRGDAPAQSTRKPVDAAALRRSTEAAVDRLRQGAPPLTAAPSPTPSTGEERAE